MVAEARREYLANIERSVSSSESDVRRRRRHSQLPTLKQNCNTLAAREANRRAFRWVRGFSASERECGGWPVRMGCGKQG